MRFVVIGGDAAGMSAASRAKRNPPDMDVTVFEETMDVSYSACGMPYNIADPARDVEDLVVRRAETFREKQGIQLEIDHRVEAIDVVAKTVSGTTGYGDAFSTGYDRLLIATGASPLIPAFPGTDLPGVVALKHLSDARRIKRYLHERSVVRVVIVGMGYIALEMAEALSARRIGVSLIKPRKRLLPWMDAPLADALRNELIANGVAVFDGHEIAFIEPSGAGLRVKADDITLAADLVLIATGIRPNSELARDANIALSVHEAVATDTQCRTSAPDVFAAGDCADALHVVSEEPVWIPLALRANRAGWAVADNVCGVPTNLAGVAGTAVFKVFGLEAARTGLTAGEAAGAGFSPVSVTITSRSRGHAYPGASDILVHMVGDAATGRLLGVQMVGRDGVAHRINAPAVALHHRLTVAEYSQTDLAYAPPFGPTWDPTLVAANQLLKKISP